MTTAQVKIPRKLIPLFSGRADVRAARGGRGSGKTRTFAKMAAVRGYIYGMAGQVGQIVCGRQFMNSLEDSSLEECKRAIEDEPFLRDYYEIGDKYIKSRDGRIVFTFCGLDRNIGSIKSKGRILIMWVDEAEPVSDYAWSIVIPTLREEGEDWNAELWVTWNPKRKDAAVEKRFAHSKDPLVKCVRINWSDNEMFPAKLERERQRDLQDRPEQYDHIWEGGFQTVVDGAVYNKELNQARIDNRIRNVPYDPSKPVETAWDLGRADKTAIWFWQQIGFEYRIIDYYEAQGYALAHYLQVMQTKPYIYGVCHLPHDADNELLGSERTIRQQVEATGKKVEIVPKLAVYEGIEIARSVFPMCYFDETKCSDGIEALQNYRFKINEETGQYSKEPLHDWASHGSDAFRYLAVSIKRPVQRRPARTHNTSGWMG